MTTVLVSGADCPEVILKAAVETGGLGCVGLARDGGGGPNSTTGTGHGRARTKPGSPTPIPDPWPALAEVNCAAIFLGPLKTGSTRFQSACASAACPWVLVIVADYPVTVGSDKHFPPQGGEADDTA